MCPEVRNNETHIHGGGESFTEEKFPSTRFRRNNKNPQPRTPEDLATPRRAQGCSLP